MAVPKAFKNRYTGPGSFAKSRFTAEEFARGKSTRKRRSASESAIRRLSRAGGGFRGSNAGFVGGGTGGGVVRFPSGRAPGGSIVAPQGTTAAPRSLGSRGFSPQAQAAQAAINAAGGTNVIRGGQVGGAGGFALGQTAGYAQASPAAPAAPGVGGGAGIAQSPAQKAQQAFLAALNRARRERGRQAGEGRALRGMALSDLRSLIRTPAMRPETVRRIQGEQVGFLRNREGTINRQTREALARGGLLTSGRGIELARRTRAELGPAGARAIGRVQSDAELANQQAIRQGLSARAGYTGSLPVVGEDLTSELQLLAESANLQGARESAQREFSEIKRLLDEAQGRREGRTSARGRIRSRDEAARIIANIPGITGAQASQAMSLVKEGVDVMEALERLGLNATGF